MRLLQQTSDGLFELTEFITKSVPPYAILSHTWGADHEEITLQELKARPVGIENRPGYQKLLFCSTQAAKDGLQYFWVDTCCIDKTSSAELSEAINSMFVWYRRASKCYVYLTDVSTHGDSLGVPLDAMWKSRWFTRGWTLQELIAPQSVEFFSKEGARIGDKISMVYDLHNITQVSVEALEGSLALREISVQERMSWIGERQTTREEDAAYCLFGIFDVHMPLIYGEGGKKAFNRLRKEIREQCTGPDELNQKSMCKPIFNVPFAPDADFVDRPDILAWVRQKLSWPGARAALVGLGGVGKSQIAIHYAHISHTNAPQTSIFWVYANSRSRFEAAYRAIADRLELSYRHNHDKDVLQLVCDWLSNEANGKWIMVLDSVDDFDIFFDESQRREATVVRSNQPKSLAKYLPKSSNGSILVTSRNKDTAAKLTGGHNNIREVRVMDASEGQKLLCTKLIVAPSQKMAAELVSSLDHIPLAISQAAAYINRNAHMDIDHYVTELRANKNKESLLRWESDDLRRDESASNSVVAAWQMSFNRIRQERPSAVDLLSLLGFFNPQSIPVWILQSCNNETRNQNDDENCFEKDLNLLQAFCFVAVTTGSKTYEMHPLVQSCTRLWLTSVGDVKSFESEFTQLMARVFPNASFDTWAECQELLPHVERLLEIDVADETALGAWSQVIGDAVEFMVLQGAHKAGNTAAVRLFSVSQKLMGPDHQITLKSIDVLGTVMRAQGRFDDAEALWQQAFTGQVKAHGQNHRTTLSTASNLAMVLRDLGKLGEAEKLNKQTLALCEGTLGLDDEQTLRTEVQLALVLHGLGRYEEAERHHRRVLESRHRSLGIKHIETLLSMNSLGGVLHAQEKYSEAEALYRQALEGRKHILLEGHPSTLTSMNNLASVLLDQEKDGDEAEMLSRQVLKWREKADEEHPHTFTSISNLARVLEARGKLDEAEALCRRALLGRESTLGQDHIDTLLSANNLAMLLKGLKRYDEATPFFQRACNGLEKSLGHEHPWTITCRGNFSDMQLETQQTHRQSLSLYARAKARMQRRNT